MFSKLWGQGCSVSNELTPTSYSVPIQDIRDGNYNIIYAHPEAVLSEAGLRLIQDIRHMICYLVVDEAHMIVEW